MQLTHYSNRFKPHRFPIILVSDHVTNSENIGGLFRTADAFGIEKFILGGSKIGLGRKVRKASRSTEKAINFEQVESIEELIITWKSKHYKIIGLEITNDSQAISNFKFDLTSPLVLIVGDENFGISAPILKLCDVIAHIDMYGQNSSMNVVQATTIGLYEITKQLTKELT